MTQEERLLRHLKTFGSITNREAVVELGIGSPTKVLSVLKSAGVELHKETVTGKNRYGEITHYTRYSLGGSNNV